MSLFRHREREAPHAVLSRADERLHGRYAPHPQRLGGGRRLLQFDPEEAVTSANFSALNATKVASLTGMQAWICGRHKLGACLAMPLVLYAEIAAHTNAFLPSESAA